MADNRITLPTADSGAELPTARRQQTRFLMESEDGSLTSVPQDKLEAWDKADHSAPLNKAEQYLKDRLLAEIFGR